MIILQTLRWSNCFSYGSNNELNLEGTTVTQIIGTNGMGKSSIPLIVEEVLYNKNSKGIKKADIPNRYINDGYSIYLSFIKNNNEYEIEVKRKSTLKVKLLKNGEDISSHTASNTYKTLQNILGLDFKTFSQLVYQNTNASLQFLTATDSNRKKFLIDLLHLEKYVELFEIFKEAHRKTYLEKTKLSGELDVCKKWLSTNKLTDTNILPMQNLEIDTSENEELLRSLTIELQNISEKNQKISKNNEYKKLVEQIDINELQKSTAKHTEFGNMLSEKGSLESTIKNAEKTVTKIESLGQHCPMCEQQISFKFKQTMLETEQIKIATAREKINELRKAIDSIRGENAEYKRVRDAIKDWEELYRCIQHNLPNSLMDKDSLVKRRERVQEELQTAKRRVEEISRENERRTRHNTRILVIQDQTNDFEEQVQQLNIKLNNIKEKESSLELLKKSFSTNGLLAYKIESLVKELEDLTNTYLSELSDGRFTLSFVTSNDKLNVEITDNINKVEITALSSGELARVNTATLIAIRRLMSSISKSKINILFLDEVINVLDDTGREKLVEVLTDEKELNTYIVSHGWTHPLLSKIEIVKENNVSKLEW